MGPLIELIATSTAREKTLNNPVEVFTADYQFANRSVTKYEIHTRRAARPPLCRQDGRVCGQGNEVAGAVRSL